MNTLFTSSYDSNKHQLLAQTNLEDLTDVSLVLGSISGPYLPFGALMVSQSWLYRVGKIADQLTVAGNATVHG